MAKALKTAALIVGAVALAVTLPGVGAGIAGAIGSAVGVSAAAVTAFATVSATALSLAAGMTAKKPGAEATGSQTQFSADPDAFIPAVLGRIMPRGSVTWRLAT